MKTLLVVDDDDAVRRLMRINLGDTYEIVDTGEPELALALALEHRPDAILLDLRMPSFDGFQLSQAFRTLCTTQSIPFFVVSGEAGASTKEHCVRLGASGYFEKPVDFDALLATLENVVQKQAVPKRTEVSVNLHVPIKLVGKDCGGRPFEVSTTTDSASVSGFLCACSAHLDVGSAVQVYLLSSGEKFAGKARVTRTENDHKPHPRYGFRFVDKTDDWVLK
jgi:CheY-like chemotaxis protein